MVSVLCILIRKMTPQEKFKNMIKYSIATAFVKPDKKNIMFSPVNLLLIASAECGKTRLLNQIKCVKTYTTLDLSPKIITSKIVPLLEKQEIAFLVIPDMIQMMGHKKTTSGSTIGFLNALIEEGIKDSDFYGLEFHLKKPVSAGLITAITTEEFYDNILKWNNIGFLHRILPISYDYSETTVQDIHNIISSGELFKEINEINVKKNKPVSIDIPKLIGSEIQILVYKIVDRFKELRVKTYKGGKNRNPKEVYFDIKGFRLHDRLRQIIRAICFIDSKGKRKIVNADDFLKLRDISEILNFPNTKLKI